MEYQGLIWNQSPTISNKPLIWLIFYFYFKYLGRNYDTRTNPHCFLCELLTKFVISVQIFYRNMFILISSIISLILVLSFHFSNFQIRKRRHFTFPNSNPVVYCVCSCYLIFHYNKYRIQTSFNRKVTACKLLSLHQKWEIGHRTFQKLKEVTNIHDTT